SAAARSARWRRWRGSASSVPRRSPAFRPSSCGPCRTQLPRATGRAGESTTHSPTCAKPCRGCSRPSMPELPPPLPPAERTVGQVIAESIRAYGHRFWPALPLGLPLAIADQLNAGQPWGDQPIVYWALTPLFVAAYLWGCRLVLAA